MGAAMDLILWRHAEAEDGVPDLTRKLTPKGAKQAQRMAEWLERHLPERCRILASPAVRAQETARALGRRFRTVDDIAPGASRTVRGEASEAGQTSARAEGVDGWAEESAMKLIKLRSMR